MKEKICYCLESLLRKKALKKRKDEIMTDYDQSNSKMKKNSIRHSASKNKKWNLKKSNSSKS